MKRQVALDTETTGKSDDGTPGDHRIIEIGCVEIIDRKLTGRQLQLYVNPERAVDEEAFGVHGISDEFLQDKPKFATVAHELIDFIRGSELLIHNAKFDVGFLDKEWMLLGMSERTADMATVVDTVSLAMKLCPGHQVNLDNLCNIYDVDRSARTMHGALLDAQILAEVYLAMTGGQKSFNFGDGLSAVEAKRWLRPQGAHLPRMGVEAQRRAVHIVNMIELSQSRPLREVDVVSMGGSTWSSDYDCPFLKKGEEEGKKEYKARLAQQKQELMDKLLTEEQRKLYEQFLEIDHQQYQEWEDRVMGRVKKS